MSAEMNEAHLRADLIAEKWDDDLRVFAPWRFLPPSELREQCIGVPREEEGDDA